MSENSQGEQQPKKASPASKRPALAIYRPPGTRNSTEKTTPETNGVLQVSPPPPPPPAKQQQQMSVKESSEKKLDKKKDNKNNNNKNKENSKKENGTINHKPKKEENNNNINNAAQPMIKHQKSKSRDGGLPKTPQSKPNHLINPSKTISNKLANQVDRQEMFHQQRRSKSRDSIKIGQFGAQFQKTNTPPKSREAPAAFLRATPIMGRRGFDGGHHGAFSRPLNPEAAPFVPSALKQSVSPPAANGALPQSSLSPPVRTASAPINIGKASSVKLDWPEARQILIKLDLASLMPFLDESGPSLQEQKTAEVAAHDLFQKIVEANSISTSNKHQARAVAAMLERCNDRDPIHEAIGAELWQYFECRDNLRVKHFRYWLSFVTFTAEVYSATGLEYDHETFVKVMLRNFDYMLHEPILESLRIEELEAIISALLSCGYDLERQCPDELAALKDSIRDAFVQAREPWARKMILLLVELAASGWRLPPQANEYYFEATNGA